MKRQKKSFRLFYLFLFFFAAIAGINLYFRSGHDRTFRAPEHLYYVSAPDSDFTFSNPAAAKRDEVPDEVGEVIHAIVRKEVREVMSQCHPGECQNVAPESFYGPIVKVSAPRNLSLFVFTLKDYFHGQLGSYFFILYDPRRRKVSSAPVSIQSQTLNVQRDPLVSKPLINFEDLDEDGTAELVAEERIHRGEAYNALIYHYFEFDHELSLFPIFEIESKMVIPGTDGTGMLVRSSRKISRDNLEVEVFLHSAGQPPRKVGEALYVLDRNSSRYEMQSKRTYLKKYDAVLISGAQGEIN